MLSQAVARQIQIWSIDRLVFYAKNPGKNDAAVAHMIASIREYGFKIPVLARSSGEVVDGHLRLKAATKARYRRSPGDHVRRMDRSAGEGVPADVESVGGLGRMDAELLA